MDKEITSTITVKSFKCRSHGDYFRASTNHWGAIYSQCPSEVISQVCISDCLDPMPEGFEKPRELMVTEIRDMRK